MALPFPDESFDVVISNGVIDLIPDKDAVFSELHRVLVPGGRIQIADVTSQNPAARTAVATSTSVGRLNCLGAAEGSVRSS